MGNGTTLPLASRSIHLSVPEKGNIIGGGGRRLGRRHRTKMKANNVLILRTTGERERERERESGREGGSRADRRPPFRTSSSVEHVIRSFVCSSLPPSFPRSQGYSARNTETVINEAMFANGKSDARGERPHRRLGPAIVHCIPAPRATALCVPSCGRDGKIDVVGRGGGREMGIPVQCLQGCIKRRRL